MGKNSFLNPKPLQSGDVVRVVACSSTFNHHKFLKGIENLKKLGLKPKYSKTIFSKLDYLAGSEKRRFREFKKALQDKGSQAILFARGGFGAAHLIPYLEKEKIKPPLKILAGFSDLTTLHLYVQKKWKWVTYYSPHVSGFSQDRLTKESFCQTLFQSDAQVAFDLPDLKTIRSGNLSGVITGGCLSLVTASLGTVYEVETKNRILFLEDICEEPYEIDRMLTHLKLAGKFKGCLGVVFGSMSGKASLDFYERVFRRCFSDYSFPVAMNFPGGHCKNMLTVPFGKLVEINTRRKKMVF